MTNATLFPPLFLSLSLSVITSGTPLIMPMFMPGYIPSDKCEVIERYLEMSNFFLNIHGYYFLLGVHLYFFVFCNGNLIMPIIMPGFIPSDKYKAIET